MCFGGLCMSVDAIYQEELRGGFFFTTELDWLRYSGCLGRSEGWNRRTRVASMRVLIAYKGPDLGSLFGFWMLYRSQIRILSVVYPFLSHVSFAATGNVTAFASI